VTAVKSKLPCQLKKQKSKLCFFDEVKVTVKRKALEEVKDRVFTFAYQGLKNPAPNAKAMDHTNDLAGPRRSHEMVELLLPAGKITDCKLGVDVKFNSTHDGAEHPRISLDRGKACSGLVFEVGKKAEFALKEPEDSFPSWKQLFAFTNPFRAFSAYWNHVQPMTLTVDSCGCRAINAPASRFATFSIPVNVYPGNVFKVAVEFPPWSTHRHETELSEEIGGNRLTVKRSEDKVEKHGEKAKTTSEGEFKYTRASGSRSDWTKIPPPRPKGEPRKKAPESGEWANDALKGLTITRDGASIEHEIKWAALVDKWIELTKKAEEAISVIDEMYEKAPKAGVWIDYEFTFFQGSFEMEWAFRERHDHTVFHWWKVEAGLKLFSFEINLKAGIEIPIVGEAFLYIKGSAEASLTGSLEAAMEGGNPHAGIKGEGKGHLEAGAEAKLGGSVVNASVKAKASTGVTGEISFKDGKWDNSLVWEGIEVDVTVGVHVIFGTAHKTLKFHPMKPKKLWATEE
jgi:hypothetical protein